MTHRFARASVHLPLLLLFVATATGCKTASSGDEDGGVADAADEDGDTRSGFHDVTVNWTLKNVDGSVMTACPPGFTTIYMNLYRNPDGLVAPPDAEWTVPCTPQGTVTRPVATAGRLLDVAGGYGGYFDYGTQKDFVVRVTEETLSSFAASTSYYYVENLASALTLDFDIYPAGGVGTFAWQFQSSLTAAALPTCAAAGVDQLEVGIRPYADDAAAFVTVGTWGCNEVDPYQYYEPNGNGFAQIDGMYEIGSGTTGGIAVGEYRTEVRAKRAGVVVGSDLGQLIIENRNDANPISPGVITINDR